MKRLLILFTTLSLLTGCKDIFTTSVFESLAKSAEDMSTEEIDNYLEETPLKDIPEEQLEVIEDTLLEEYDVIEADDLQALKDASADDPVAQQALEEYAEENVQLLEINMEQADVEGLITTMLTESEGSGEEGGEENSEEVFTEILEDEERLEDLEAASGFAVEAFKADEDSLSGEQLVVGSLGLVSEIIQIDDPEVEPLDEVDDYETETLLEAGYTADQVEDIQLAADMMEAAEGKLPEDMAAALEGLPF